MKVEYTKLLTCLKRLKPNVPPSDASIAPFLGSDEWDCTRAVAACKRNVLLAEF
jgi:hypothetical protein